MVVKKAVTAKKTGLKGQVLTCQVCGMVVTVTESCGCGPECEIICCGKPLKVKKA